MDSIAGRYPGGPRRTGPGLQALGREPRLSTVGQIEDRLARKRVGRRRRRRKVRIVVGLVVAFSVAAIAGAVIGLQSHREARDVAAKQEAKSDKPFDFEKEKNHLLRELWKMEELERIPRGR